MTASWKDAPEADWRTGIPITKKTRRMEVTKARLQRPFYICTSQQWAGMPCAIGAGDTSFIRSWCTQKCSTAVLYLQAAAESAAKVSKNEGMSVLWSLSYFHSTQVTVSKDDVLGNAMEVEQEMAWTMILSNI